MASGRAVDSPWLVDEAVITSFDLKVLETFRNEPATPCQAKPALDTLGLTSCEESSERRIGSAETGVVKAEDPRYTLLTEYLLSVHKHCYPSTEVVTEEDRVLEKIYWSLTKKWIEDTRVLAREDEHEVRANQVSKCLCLVLPKVKSYLQEDLMPRDPVWVQSCNGRVKVRLTSLKRALFTKGMPFDPNRSDKGLPRTMHLYFLAMAVIYFKAVFHFYKNFLNWQLTLSLLKSDEESE